ncbi:alpha/beta hydrolase [Kordiimonas lacus]|uniref:Proline iminopeptidase n=1 Tax=Kordiimonas lacus TaxID=637679 RepID=A0A1G7BH22_9PROT|nr:alpha/beta hydrolase [Kordiimonas lacus]SDE25736.1 Pimeloyl-ACP methyl ester carboxylesterase [Kordiimonas lacus]
MKSRLFASVMLAGLFSSAAMAQIKGEKAIQFEARGADPVAAFEGELMVPENRSNADSRMIPIRYVRFPATGEKKGPPIIYLAGGPGGSGIATAKYRRFAMFMALRAYGDVIALDQRGTGASNILPGCNSDQHVPTDHAVSDAAYVAMHRAALEECVAFWKAEGVDIKGYNTLENVHDVDALRAHLGADKMVLWGTSYGSHMALAALKEFEGRIDRVVLSSAEGLNQTIKLPARTDAYFDRLQAAVDSQPTAKAAYGDIKALIRRVHDKLENAPVPLKVKMRDGAVADMMFTRRDMQMVASGMVSDPSWGASRLLMLYLALDNGITAPLEEGLGRFIDPREPISMSPMSVLMDIASGMTGGKKALVAEQAKTAFLKDYLNFSYHYDGMFPELDLGDDFRAKPVSDVPVLLFSGTLDGRTYLEGQAEAVAGLSNLTHITVVNAGHNLYMSTPDVQAAINRFMEGEPPASDTITTDLPDFTPKM